MVHFLGGGSHFCVCWPLFVFVLGGLSSFLGSRLQWWSVGVDVVAGRSLVVVGGVVGVVVVVVVVVGDERKPCHTVFGWWFVW